MPLSAETETILIIDDNEHNLQVVGTTLMPMGYDIVPASSGEAAFQRIRAKRPDLILLDVQMPDVDGFEVCRRLRADPETFDIPVIFLSASDEKNIIVKALEQGAVDYVTKPFNKAELLSRVRSHLEMKRAKDRLRKLLDERDEFIGVMAHDLKNPLSGILLSAALAQERYSDGDDTMHKLLESIRSTSEEALGFLDRFLEDTVRNTAPVKLALKPVDLVSVVHDEALKYRAAAEKKGIELLVDLEEKPLTVMGEPLAIARVVANLVSNAVKFCSQGDRVTVAVEPVLDGGRLIVADTGPGFTEEDQAKMFEKFVQLSAAPTAGERSTGLGLSIVKRLVELMHGKIVCVSESGEGARFSAEFPVVAPARDISE